MQVRVEVRFINRATLKNKGNGRCGDPGHYADRCPYKTMICKFCSKIGHLEKMCLVKTKKKTDGTHHLEEQPCIIKDVFHLSTAGPREPSMRLFAKVARFHPLSSRFSAPRATPPPQTKVGLGCKLYPSRGHRLQQVTNLQESPVL
ncbi:uncharacterized protein LOC118514108 [Anopheles stephensi]|uniref:uncharacterized protein LOC118514108 n=1 Tax=Anopheles stephensi TaxID=30069 RepID=UPI001658BC86|nr:uncharacterized protein LOC118514108 [Anopheles stephensi]